MAVVTKVGNWDVISQDPGIADPIRTAYAEQHWLPELVRLAQHIEAVTGFKWDVTSYWRNSPSHRKGCALDIAPSIHPQDRRYYAFYKRSDPVLYKRTTLMRLLQRAASTFTPAPSYDYAIVVEPDHLHLHLFSRNDDPSYARVDVYKWKVPKESYPDTHERMKLPMLSDDYLTSNTKQ